MVLKVEDIRTEELQDYLNKKVKDGFFIRNIFPYITNRGIINQVIYCSKEDVSVRKSELVCDKKVRVSAAAALDNISKEIKEDAAADKLVYVTDDGKKKERVKKTRVESSDSFKLVSIDRKYLVFDKIFKHKVSSCVGDNGGLSRYDIVYNIISDQPRTLCEISKKYEYISRKNMWPFVLDNSLSETIFKLKEAGLIYFENKYYNTTEKKPLYRHENLMSVG